MNLEGKRGETAAKNVAHHHHHHPSSSSREHECAQLDVALQRISLLDDSKLEKTLSKLLPMAIAQLSSPHALTKQKTVGLLTHINKRTNGLPEIEFPLDGLVDVVLNAKDSSLVRNFGMMYATKAFERSRLKRAEKGARVERLLEALFNDGGINDEQTVQNILRVAIDVIGAERPEGYTSKWMSNARTKKRFLRHVLAVAQYQPNLAKAKSSTSADVEFASAEMRRAREEAFISGVARLAGNASPSGGAAAPTEEEEEYRAGPGLSESLLKEILGDVVVSDKEARAKARESIVSSIDGRWRVGIDLKSLAERKKALLEFLAEACVYEDDNKENETTEEREGEDENTMQVELPTTVKKYIVSAEELFPIALAVACDASETCRSYGETVLKKRCGVDGTHPDLDANNEAFITHQLRWFLGDNESVPSESRVHPANDEIRSNILRRVLSRSQLSANLFPQNVEVISSSLNNPRSKQLRSSGMEFSAWVLRNAERDVLEKAAPKLLETCLMTLDTLETSSPTNMTTSERIRAVELKGFCFQSLGHLIERAPELIKSSQDMMIVETTPSKSSIDAVEFLKRVLSDIENEYDSHTRSSIVECGRALLRACEGDSIVKEGEKLAMEYIVAEVLERYASTVFTSADVNPDVTNDGKTTPPGSKSALLLALRFAGSEKCFRFNSVAVRFACILNCARPELDIRDAARKALALRNKRSKDGYPTVTRMLDRAETKNTLLAKDPQREDDQSPLPEKAMFALLKFLRQSRRFHMEGGDDDASIDMSYFRFLKHCLLRTSGPRLASLAFIELRDVLFSAHKAEGFSCAANENNYQYYLRAAKFFSTTDDAIARKASANLIGTMLKLNAVAESDVEVLVSGFLKTASKAVALNESDEAAAANLRAEHADGALRSLSALISIATKEMKFESIFTPERYKAAKSIFRKAMLNVPRTDAPSKEVLLGVAGCECLGTLFVSYNKYSGNATSIISNDDITALSQAMDRALAAPKVAAAAAFAAGCALRRRATVETSFDAAKILVEKLFSLLTVKKDDVRFAVADAVKLGFYGETDLILSTDIASEDGGDASLSPFVRDIDREVDELFESLKESESTKIDAKGLSSVKMDADAPTDEVDVNRNALREIVLKYLFDDDDKDGGEFKVGVLFNSREEIRCGATAILCSLVNPAISSASIVSDDVGDTNDDDVHAKKGTKVNAIPLLESRFDDAHDALLSALGDTNTTTQEMASSGLSILYDRGDEASKATLLENLTKALSGETSNKGKKRAMSKVDDDTVVFQDGLNLTGDDALKEKAQQKTKAADAGRGGRDGGDSMLSTYKELCSVVSDIGQPDLLYKFMEISNHQKKVNRAASAGAGIARIAKKAGISLSAHSEQLAPRLYRLRKDVNLNMRETAEAAWQTLVVAEKGGDNNNESTSTMVVASDLSVKMFDQICERLLLDCSSREWRVRQSAAEALAELFSSGGAGKTFDTVEKKIAEAWTIAFRVADDIKETVRIRGMMFVKSLRSLSLRLTDANQIGDSMASAARDKKRDIAKRACILILPQLFEKGLKSDSSVARELSLFVACEILKKAPAEALKPHCVTAVEALLEALSTFEDTRLNYYEQRVTAIFGNDTDDNGNNSAIENFQNARVQASSNSIVSDALDAFIQHVELEETKLLAPVFSNIFKKGLGLNTKVGAGRFCVRLCARRPDAVKGFFAGKICEALLASPDVLNGVSSGGASSKIVFRQYCQTFATCLRFATLKRQEKTIADVLKLANDGSSNTSNREAAAEIIYEIAKDSRGVECLKDFEDDLLPLAYFGTFDENASVAKCWESAWEELSGGGAGATGGGSAIGKHFPNLWKSFLKPHLEGSNYSLKSRAARTISSAMKSTSFSTKNPSINNTDEMNAEKEKMMRDILAVFSNELRSNRAFKGKNDLAIALGDVLKAMISMAMVERNGSNEDATGTSFEALNRLLKCIESKDDSFSVAGVEALKNVLEHLVASGPGEEENVAPSSFVKNEKFQSFVGALVSNLAMRVSNVDGNASRITKSDGEEDEMETDGADAEAERFEKNKSKTAFTARAMECLSVVSELNVASSDMRFALYRIAIEHSAVGKSWQNRVASFRMFRGLFTSAGASLSTGEKKYDDEFLRASREALFEVGNSAPAALRIEAIKAVGAMLSRAKAANSSSAKSNDNVKETCESIIKTALEDRSPDVRREAASVYALYA